MVTEYSLHVNRRRKILASFGVGHTRCLPPASCSTSTVLTTQTTDRLPKAQAPVLPSEGSVADGRFVRPVELDDGILAVEPPTPGQQPTLSQSHATTAIWASSALLGHHAGPIGFGIVTITLQQAGVPKVTSLPAWIGFAVAATASCPMETAPTGPTTTLPDLPSNWHALL